MEKVYLITNEDLGHVKDEVVHQIFATEENEENDGYILAQTPHTNSIQRLDRLLHSYSRPDSDEASIEGGPARASKPTTGPKRLSAKPSVVTPAGEGATIGGVRPPAS